MKTSTLIPLFAVLLLFAAPARAGDYFVNDASVDGDVWCNVPGDDGNDGSTPGTPMASIQALLNAWTVHGGDTIYVDTGLYVLDSNIVVDAGHGGTDLTWFRIIGTGRGTVLERRSSAPDAYCIDLQADYSHVEGLTCRDAGVGICVDADMARNVRLVGNICYGNTGAGIEILPRAAGPGGMDYAVSHNVLYANAAGINMQPPSGARAGDFVLTNNTIVVLSGPGIACGGNPGGTVLQGNIVVAGGAGYCVNGDEGAIGFSDYNNLYACGGSASVARHLENGTYRFFTSLAEWQAATAFDMHSLGRDPLFADVGAGDLHLRSQGSRWQPDPNSGATGAGWWIVDTEHSPCIDAGDPAAGFGPEPPENGARINMGAYGGTPEASMTTPGRALNLLAPNGGEVWGAAQLILWDYSGMGWFPGEMVSIQYAYNGEPVWHPIPGAEMLPHEQKQVVWNMPDPDETANYLVRVVSVDDPGTSDASANSVVVPHVGATYYVNDAFTNNDVYCAAPGMEANDGLSPTTPVASLSRIFETYSLDPGDTVYVDTGTYGLMTNVVIPIGNDGAPGSYVRVVGSQAGSVLDRQATHPGARCIELHADYFRLEQLVCTGGAVGISANAASCRNAEIVGNTCYGNVSNGIEIVAYVPGGGKQYLVLQNLVYSNGHGIYLSGGNDPAAGRAVFLVENNSVANCELGIVCAEANSAGRRTMLLKNNIVHAAGASAACLVSVPGALHYSDFNNFFASGGASVALLAPDATGTLAYTSMSAWRGASGFDGSSLSQDSLFVDPGSADFRLQSASPCIDSGVNGFWMFGGEDLGGSPRIFGSTVDMGAYEGGLKAYLKIYLQGPYQPGTNTMRRKVNTQGLVPLTAPYAAAPRSVSTIPSSAVDWVLVQFRTATNGPPVFSRSAFLRQDGIVMADDGTAGIGVSLPGHAAYFVVVKHRHHLAAMSAAPVPFMGQVMNYDFTFGPDRFFGDAAGCVEVDPGVWGMLAGDADGDGRILPVDDEIYQSHEYMSGYRRADFDMNAVVLPPDRNFVIANAGRNAPLPRPETILHPGLRVAPVRTTLLPGDTQEFEAYGDDNATGVIKWTFGDDNATSAFTWSFVQNSSGAAVTTQEASVALYTAGSGTQQVDVIQSWDAQDRLGRAYVNVLGTQDVAQAGRVIIMAGRKSSADPLWPTTDYLADVAYTTLRYRGFSKENIHYLSPDPNQDVDGNGSLDDIDLETTWTNAALSMTNWAADSERLFIYMPDHGGDSSGQGFFRLNPSETLTASQLDTWLDELQDTYNTEVTLLLDFCYAGSFIDELDYAGAAKRIVIAACSSNQPSYFVAGGLVSFSDAFFSGILIGYDVKQSFDLAQNAMAVYQDGEIDDNGDGLYQDGIDGANAEGYYIGPTFVSGGDAPQIGEVCGNQVLSEDTAGTLWVGSIASVYPLARVWCLIIPPGHDPDPEDPVVDLPELKLSYDASSGRYAVTYEGFSAPGTYKVLFYASDTWGNVSPPRQSYVAQIGYDDRFILVAGGPTNSPRWQGVDYLARLAFNTARLRLFDADHVRYLSPVPYQDLDADGTNDVDAAPSLSALGAAITGWALQNTTDRMTLYLLGGGTNDTMRLNDTESLTASQLAAWLDAFQTTNPVLVNVVLDFPGSGAFVPTLAVSNLAASVPAAERIVTTATRAGRDALMSNGGTVSYSQYLLSSIVAGHSFGDAVTTARRTIRRASGGVRQRARLDDNGNGVPNEKNVDGKIAEDVYIGSAFMTGADSPIIGSVNPVTVLAGPQTLTLWAADVTAMLGISNVWCVITPPEYDGQQALPATNLAWNASNARYETDYAGFTRPGTYILTFYARDNAGEVSDAVQTEVITADRYEPDDTSAQASLYHGSVQAHNFHTSSDADWARFYAVSNFAYEIETFHVSTNLDTVLDIYRELPGGVLELVDHVDEEGSDLGEFTGLDFPATGYYYIKVSQYVSGQWRPGTYELIVDIPVGDGEAALIVVGINRVTEGALPTGAWASVSGEGTNYFDGSVNVTFNGLSAGTYTVTVPSPLDFFPREDPDYPDQVPSLTNIYYANPREVEITEGWASANFELIPHLDVEGLVRDAWTYAFLEGVKIEFEATSGSFTGYVAEGSVIFTNYETNWYSGTNGAFPSGVVLSESNWDLMIAHTGYMDFAQIGAVSNAARGSVVDLGALFLVPVDDNSNGIADAWEDVYFPGSGAVGTNDPDGDGLTNWEEYIGGTDPTNVAKSLYLTEAEPAGAGGFALEWDVVAGRSYQVGVCPSLTTGAWTFAAGPWEAAAGQTEMQWTDTNAPSHQFRFYRIELNVP